MEIQKGDYFQAIGVDQSIEILGIKKGDINPKKPDVEPKWFFEAIIRRNGFTNRHDLEIESYTPKLLDSSCYDRKRVLEIFNK